LFGALLLVAITMSPVSGLTFADAFVEVSRISSIAPRVSVSMLSSVAMRWATCSIASVWRCSLICHCFQKIVSRSSTRGLYFFAGVGDQFARMGAPLRDQRGADILPDVFRHAPSVDVAFKIALDPLT
jgi:hypothetical protein